MKIKIIRLEKTLAVLKWLCFLTCCALCIWKIADSFVTFGEKEVGTKIELKYNHETDFPGFAVCRHPNQILKKIDDANETLQNVYDLSLSDIRYLTAFEKVALHGMSSIDLYNRFVFNDSESVASVVLSSRGQYAGTATPSLVSKPETDTKEWSSFWHPLYGICFTFKLNKTLVDVVGDAGLEFVKVNLNFDKAFPVLAEDEQTTEESLLSYESSETGEYMEATTTTTTEESTEEAETTTEPGLFFDTDDDNTTLYTEDETGRAAIQ